MCVINLDPGTGLACLDAGVRGRHRRVLRESAASGHLQRRAEGKRVLAKLTGWIVGILVVVWIVSTPAGAGNDVHSWISGILSFFQHLAQG
jgi:hypothetical protein